jgi:hypothetical protein
VSTALAKQAAGRGDSVSLYWKPPQPLGRPQWVNVGKRLARLTRASQWWVGDWVRYGTSRWGEKYVEAARVTGYDVHSLENMVHVASRFEISRRRENLSWSHHAAVASLDVDAQEYWLNRAAEERMAVQDLRIEVRAAERVLERDAESDSDPSAAESSQLNPEESHITCPHCGHQIALPARDTDYRLTSSPSA